MALRLSRRKLAAHAVEQLSTGAKKSTVLKEVAAYLIETRRTRELDLFVRDLEDAFAERGIIVADVTSAHVLSDDLKTEVKKLVSGKDVQLRASLDPDVLGGIRVEIPGKRFDGTLRHKLTLLKAKQL